RARAEGLGIELAAGIMQRAERIVLVTGGTLIAAWFAPDAPAIAVAILGITMLLTALASTATAAHRWLVAYRAPAEREGREPVVARPRELPAGTAPVRRFTGVRPVELH